MFSSRSLIAAAALSATAVLAGCGADNSSAASQPAPGAESIGAPGIRVVSPEEAAGTIAEPPADLVILDVRTQEEFDQAHIDGAVMLDFYREDFAEELAQLDPDVPYVLYCRSGNRSGQARAMMAELGFVSVDDVNGGIVNWVNAGLPIVNG